MMRLRVLTVALLSLVSVSEVEADTHTFSEPDFDRWMYVNNSTPGRRPIASTFSALPGSVGDENRLAQFLIGFETLSGGAPEWEAVQVERVIITAATVDDGAFVYDPTYDSFTSYLQEGADIDAGRPVVLHGAGFRNDYDLDTFLENSPHGSGAPYGRNAFPLAFDAVGSGFDVSHNVTDGFEFEPWAVGAADVTPGDPVPFDTVFSFEVDLSAPGISNYVRESLIGGKLFFTISSLHPATQQAGEFVNFYTRESTEHQIFGNLAPRLVIEYSVVPTPELPPLTITQMGFDPDTGLRTIGWDQHSGYTYTVQRSEDLRGWEDVTESTAVADGPGTYTFDAGDDQELFHRVVRHKES